MCQVRLATSTALYSWLWLRHVYSANAYLASYPLPQYVMYMLSRRGRSENRDRPLPHPHSSRSHRCDKSLRSTNALLIQRPLELSAMSLWCTENKVKWLGRLCCYHREGCMLAAGWVELISGSGRRNVAIDKSHLIWVSCVIGEFQPRVSR